MLGISFSEILIILLATLICYGPNKLPEFFRQAGRFFVQLRRMSNEVKDVVETVIQQAEKEVRLEELAKEVKKPPATPSSVVEGSSSQYTARISSDPLGARKKSDAVGIEANEELF